MKTVAATAQSSNPCQRGSLRTNARAARNSPTKSDASSAGGVAMRSMNG